ncbi:MAG TPA: YlmC/YmxH family sporulation protein [Desulfotomaculum sp.]|nr:YlmC/YmxH family sporulation protein [Desulfotomaculum sp.]
MRLTELVGKEIINLYDGARLGVVGDSDLTIDADSGQVQSIILPRRPHLLNMWAERQHMVIPWEAVKKVGSEVIVVELDHTTPRFR